MCRLQRPDFDLVAETGPLIWRIARRGSWRLKIRSKAGVTRRLDQVEEGQNTCSGGGGFFLGQFVGVILAKYWRVAGINFYKIMNQKHFNDA
jgi:hypothetical protein